MGPKFRKTRCGSRHARRAKEFSRRLSICQLRVAWLLLVLERVALPYKHTQETVPKRPARISTTCFRASMARSCRQCRGALFKLFVVGRHLCASLGSLRGAIGGPSGSTPTPCCGSTTGRWQRREDIKNLVRAHSRTRKWLHASPAEALAAAAKAPPLG